MKVEIGAGARAHDGYLAFDVNPKNADIIGDAFRLPFRNGSVEALRAVDVLEHISYRWTRRALIEWARVLAFGGDLFVQVPDADTIMRWYVYGNDRLGIWEKNQSCSALRGAEWRLLGGHQDGKYAGVGDDWRWNAHFSLWSRESLTEAVMAAGLGVRHFERNGHPNLLLTAVKR